MKQLFEDWLAPLFFLGVILYIVVYIMRYCT